MLSMWLLMFFVFIMFLVLLMLTRWHGPRWPSTLTPSQQMHMNMEHTLPRMLPIIDDNPIPFIQLEVFGDLRRRIQQPPQDLNVLLFGLSVTQPIT